MYQCFVTNEWEQIQSTAELQLGGKYTNLIKHLLLHLIFVSIWLIVRSKEFIQQINEYTKQDNLQEIICSDFIQFSNCQLDASPELLYWFSEQTLQPGPTVSLKCVATGNPPPQFTWTLDGFPVSKFFF